MGNELKRCCCGGKAVAKPKNWESQGDGWASITCSSCGASVTHRELEPNGIHGEAAHIWHVEQAKNLWNSRPQPAGEFVELVERIEANIEQIKAGMGLDLLNDIIAALSRPQSGEGEK